MQGTRQHPFVIPLLFAAYSEAQDLVSTKVRALVARAPWGAPVVTSLLARVGRLSDPITRHNSISVRLDAALEDWELLTPEEGKQLTGVLTETAETVMKVRHNRT